MDGRSDQTLEANNANAPRPRYAAFIARRKELGLMKLFTGSCFSNEPTTSSKASAFALLAYTKMKLWKLKD